MRIDLNTLERAGQDLGSIWSADNPTCQEVADQIMKVSGKVPAFVLGIDDATVTLFDIGGPMNFLWRLDLDDDQESVAVLRFAIAILNNLHQRE